MNGHEVEPHTITIEVAGRLLGISRNAPYKVLECESYIQSGEKVAGKGTENMQERAAERYARQRERTRNSYALARGLGFSASEAAIMAGWAMSAPKDSIPRSLEPEARPPRRPNPRPSFPTVPAPNSPAESRMDRPNWPARLFPQPASDRTIPDSSARDRTGAELRILLRMKLLIS